MSGYLQRLVERTLGAGSIVRPRITPRFAGSPPLVVEQGDMQESLPSVAQDDARLLESESMEKTPASPSLPPPLEPQAALPVEGVPASQTRQVSPKPDAEGELRSQQRLEIAPQETLPVARYPVGPSNNSDQPSFVSLTEKSQRESTPGDSGGASSAESRQETAGSHELSGEYRREEKPGVQIGPRITKTEVHLHVSPDDLHDGGIQAPGVNAALRPKPAPPAGERQVSGPAPNPSSPTRPAAPGASLQAEDQPQPVIRVTIGRIEVRASVASGPPSPRPEPQRTKPALTLQEYLEQRSGGER